MSVLRQAIGAYVSSVGGVTVNWPTHLTNDVAVLFVQTANETPSFVNAQGFQEIASTGTGTPGASGATRLSTYWCRATSNAMPSPELADCGDHVIAFIVTARGAVSVGVPVLAFNTNQYPTPVTTSGCPPVTADYLLDFVLFGVSLGVNGTTNVWSAQYVENSYVNSVGLAVGVGGVLAVHCSNLNSPPTSPSIYVTHTNAASANQTIIVTAHAPPIEGGAALSMPDTAMRGIGDLPIGGRFVGEI